MKNAVAQLRFDLDVGIEFLDLDSTIALLTLSDLWRARAWLRSLWLMRAALDALPGVPLSQVIYDMSANDWK